MKKLLALVLAMVMTLGLATVGTNAVDKFADADSIKFTEAATVMKAIGVFDGDDSGNFRPTETLKRSEAAKIVAYLMLTKKTADGLIPSGTRYVDVPANHWAAGYIEYLTSEGVLGGVGNGMFNPDGDITGIDFAKMLLVALGYDAKLENLVLSDYRINTAKLANSIDLFDGNTDMVPTAAITRDEAVLYAFNMIRCPMVEYDSNVRVDSGNGSVVTVGNNRAYEKTSSNQSKQTVSYKKATRNAQYSTDAPWMVEFAEEKYPDLKLSDVSANNEKGIGADAFGRPSRKWLWKNEDLGRFVMTQDLVTSWNKKVTAKMLYDQLGKTIYDSLKDRNSKLDSWLDGMQIINDNYYADTVTLVNVGEYLNRDNTTKINGSGNGTVTEVYMDKDKNVTIVTMNVFVYQAAADYNKNSKTLRITPAGETSEVLTDKYGYRLNSNELKLEDFADIENYKTDDYLLAKVAWTENGNIYEVKEIEKAEKITGKVDSYTSDGTYSVTMDGTKHDYAVTTESTSNDTRATMYSVGKDATIVVDKAGYIYAVDEAIVTTDYVFITKFGKGNTDLKDEAYASAYFTDGTNSTIKLKSVYNFTTQKQVTTKSDIIGWGENVTSQAGQWYTYSKNTNNEYTLYAPQKGYLQYSSEFNYVNNGGDKNVVMSDGQVYFAQSTAGTTKDLTSSRADDKTVIVVNDRAKDQVNIYTGVKNVPGVSLNNGSQAKIYSLDKISDNSRVAKVVFVDLTGSALVTGSANDNLIYVVKSDGSIRSDDVKKETHWQYQVLKSDGSGEKENIIADNQLVAFNGKYYGAANYASKNSDGLYTRFYKVSDDDAQSSTIAWGQADGDDWNGGLPNGRAMNRTYAPITYKNGALTVGGYGWTLDKDAKITVIGLYYDNFDARVINTDKEAEAEFHTNMQGSELNGMFNGLTSYTYDYALRTVNNVKAASGLAASNSRTVKELYITVRSAANDGTAEIVNEDTTGLSVVLANNVLTVYYNGTGTPTREEKLAAVYEFLAMNDYDYDNVKRNGNTYTFENVTDGEGYSVDDMTFVASDDATKGVSVWNVKNEAYEAAATGTAYTVSADATKITANDGYYIYLNGTWYSKDDGAQALSPYDLLDTAEVCITIDGTKRYFNDGASLKNYVGSRGNGWKTDMDATPYLAYYSDADAKTYQVVADATMDGKTFETGYVQVTGATVDNAAYTKAGDPATLTVNVTTNGQYAVKVGDSVVRRNVALTTTNNTITLTGSVVTDDIEVEAMVGVAVAMKDGDTIGDDWTVALYGEDGGSLTLDSNKNVWVAEDEQFTVVFTAKSGYTVAAGTNDKINLTLATVTAAKAPVSSDVTAGANTNGTTFEIGDTQVDNRDAVTFTLKASATGSVTYSYTTGA